QPLREYALYLQGQLSVEQQHWPAVAQSMRKLLEEFPQSKLALQSEFWLAEALYRQNAFEETERRFDRLSQKVIDPAQSWLAGVALRQAQILAHRKDWNAAREIADKIAATYPGFKQQYEADYLLGRCLANEAQFDQAREAYLRAIGSAA